MQAQNLPTLAAHDAALLEDLFSLGNDLRALSDKLNRSFLELLDWAAAPAIAAYLDAFQRFDHFAQRARQNQALNKLTEVFKTSPDPIEQRRAATTVLRITQQILHPRATRTTSSALIESATVRERSARLGPSPRATDLRSSSKPQPHDNPQRVTAAHSIPPAKGQCPSRTDPAMLQAHGDLPLIRDTLPTLIDLSPTFDLSPRSHTPAASRMQHLARSAGAPGRPP